VVGKLIDHPLAVDIAFGGMVKDVHANKADEQVLVFEKRRVLMRGAVGRA
jgi:hypothetical protein